jgi:hypothetical protein
MKISKPVRVSRTYTQRLAGTPEAVFPLLCLGPQGDAFVEAFTDAHYAKVMRDREARMNHYLRTGQALQDA